MNEWISKMYIPTTGHYLVIKTSEMLIHATTGMSLGNIMVNKRSQAQKGIIIQLHLYEMSRIRKSVHSESRSGAAGRTWRMIANERGVFLG